MRKIVAVVCWIAPTLAKIYSSQWLLSLRQLCRNIILFNLYGFVSQYFACEHQFLNYLQLQYKVVADMQKRQADFKLPQIHKSTKENPKVLSKTLIDNNGTIKIRPASSNNKVDDLEKKLFSKLDAYQNVSKKHLGKRIKKDSRETGVQIGSSAQTNAQGYQKIQKLMPNLYSKLVDTKKANFTVLQTVSKPASQHLIIKSQKIISREPSNQRNSTKPSQIQIIDANPVDFSKQRQYKISEGEMKQIYQQYEGEEGLIAETSKQQLQQLGKSINFYQNQIQTLKKSMEGLIKQIGIEFLVEVASDSDQL